MNEVIHRSQCCPIMPYSRSQGSLAPEIPLTSDMLYGSFLEVTSLQRVIPSHNDPVPLASQRLPGRTATKSFRASRVSQTWFLHLVASVEAAHINQYCGLLPCQYLADVQIADEAW